MVMKKTDGAASPKPAESVTTMGAIGMAVAQDVEVTIGDATATFKAGDSVSDADRKIVSRLEQLGLLKEKE
jgi:hypothetical protein